MSVSQEEVAELSTQLQTYRSPKQALTNSAELKKYSSSIVGYGSGRIVMDSSNANSVYKIGVRNGVKQNQAEVTIYKYLSSHPRVTTLSKYIAPIRDYGEKENWIEMDKVEVIEEGISELGKYGLQMKSRFADVGIIIEDVGVGKIHTEKNKQQMVAFDFGHIKTVNPQHNRGTFNTFDVESMSSRSKQEDNK